MHGADRVPRDRQARRRSTPLPALRTLVAAGEALNPEVLRAFEEAHGIEIRDGYGQTETGQLTGNADRRAGPARARWDGRCPGVDLRVIDGELVLADPHDRPDVLRRPPRRRAGARPTMPWHTGDRVAQDEDGYLYFEGRSDDLIISAGYRIGPFEVESALVSHPAVAEAAVVAAPDEERGSVVRAVVVVRDGFAPSDGPQRPSSRSTSSARPPPTSTRGSSTSPPSCRRPRAARSQRAAACATPGSEGLD